LGHQPELIICDEVTSTLDQLVAEGILKLLQDLQDELHVSYLFITHDLATVRAIADEIIVMLQGRIVEHGPRDEILTPPHHEYTELLLASVPRDGSRLARWDFGTTQIRDGDRKRQHQLAARNYFLSAY